MFKSVNTTALAVAAAGVLATSAPAVAAPSFEITQPVAAYNGGESSVQGWRDRDYRRDGYRNDRRYSQRARYGEPVYRDTRVWRGRDGRYYCRKKNGTTGLIIGGAVGALLGREIDGGYDRTLGTILGAAGGALLGREIDRGGSRCR